MAIKNDDVRLVHRSDESGMLCDTFRNYNGTWFMLVGALVTILVMYR